MSSVRTMYNRGCPNVNELLEMECQWSEVYFM